MDLRTKTCCFTGHRNLSSGEKLKAAVRLRRVIEEQIKAGVVFYGAGGALGFDYGKQSIMRSVARKALKTARFPEGLLMRYSPPWRKSLIVSAILFARFPLTPFSALPDAIGLLKCLNRF